MKRTLILVSLALLLASCTPYVRRSQTCYETTPYDYANLPLAQKGEQVPSVPTYGNCPANVAELLMRDHRCNWWYAEEKFHRITPRPGSEAKRLAAVRWTKDLRCDSVGDEVLHLKQQYPHDPAIQRALDNASISAIN